jgi:hypothetical protein
MNLTNQTAKNFDVLVETIGMEQMYLRITNILETLVMTSVINLPEKDTAKIVEKMGKVAEAIAKEDLEECYRVSMEIGLVIHKAAIGIGGLVAINTMAECISRKISPEELQGIVDEGSEEKETQTTPEVDDTF